MKTLNFHLAIMFCHLKTLVNINFGVNISLFISKSISIFLELGIIEKIERIGVRYASVLVNTDGVNDVLNSIPTTNIEGYEQKFEQYRSNFIIDEIIYSFKSLIKKKQTLKKMTLKYLGYILILMHQLRTK